ncbi:hypothetical protein FS837_001345 [Tulasnella sp. UAMH 9824]|nr:hypothetical protein FS837_001345 [Tulasnella sp. UAMH 9824]
MKSDTSNSQRGRFYPVTRSQPTQSTVSAPRTDGDDLRRTVLSPSTPGRSRSGHPTSGGTPITPRTRQGSKSSELKSSLDPLIKNEIERNLIEIEAEAFIRAFLYPSAQLGEPDTVMERDRGLGEACHEMLQEGISDDDVLMSMLTDDSCPKYSENGFTLLDVTKEEHLYTPFRKLFTFISAFYRLSLRKQSPPLDIDAAWPEAVDPKPQNPGDTTPSTELLRRDFFDTHNMVLKFSPRLVKETADLKPDLVLMLHRDKNPDEKQPSVYWKDVKVPIEIKTTFKSEGYIIAQVARYARAILMEQGDRKFAITVSLSATHCRLFHWDSVGCHVTEPIDIHTNPILFIRCIARLAMMTPSELGYDDHFSNAGRVLSDQELTTTLKVWGSPIREYLDREPGSETIPEQATSSLLELDTENLLFESRGMLFHRYTRVWRGKEITDIATWKAGPTRVVKQNWAEDTRPCEGYFYMLAKDIPAVCSLVLMEECDRTWTYHSRVAERDVIGYLRATEKNSRRGASVQPEGKRSNSGPNSSEAANAVERRSRTPLNVNSGPVQSLERVLLRFVFEEEYRSLYKASSSLELLEATVHWIEGLIALDKLGIVHRDISDSNLMLPVMDQKSDTLEGSSKVAKIIDLGLAHFKDPQSGDELSSGSLLAPSGLPSPDGPQSLWKGTSTSDARASRPHHHITGTLPFIALDLIQQHIDTPNTTSIEHAVHHDVESVFWVLMYFCLFQAQGSGSGLMTAALDGLTSPVVAFVVSAKETILHVGKVFTKFIGPFHELRDFLKAFAGYYRKCFEDSQSIDALKVLSLAIEHRDKLAQDGKENPAPTTVQQPPPMTPPGLTATVDSPKRKFSLLDDSLKTPEGMEEESEEEVATQRKKTKLP